MFSTIRVLEIPKTKRSAPKTRTGCVTCKKRRVKCGEEKPHCLRCRKAGRICDGYQVPKAWLFEPCSSSVISILSIESSDRSSGGKSVSDPSTPTSTAQSRQSTRLRLPPHIQPSFGAQAETQALQYYIERTSNIASKWESGSFWCQRLPQLSWSHQALKHCLLALASVSSARFNQDGLAPILGNPLVPYCRAINLLSTGIAPVGDTSNLQLMLAASCALWTFEILRGRRDTALIHLNAGTSLHKQLNARHDADPSLLQEIQRELHALSKVAQTQVNFFEAVDEFDLLCYGHSDSEHIKKVTCAPNCTDACHHT
jgi:hypothetical protein